MLHGLENDDLRKELVEYYKWIVGLAIFVLTTSASLVALFGKDLEVKWLFAAGWVLLIICVFANWMIVKRLVTIPVVRAVPDDKRGRRHRGFERSGWLLIIYAFFQNWTFLAGTLAVIAAFAINWTGKGGG